jgi:hypothetical protein
VIRADLSRVTQRITTPLSLQHVGEYIVEIATADWTALDALRGTILSYLTELIEFWEAAHRRHDAAIDIFATAAARPYCLFLRSFAGVTIPIEVTGARAVMFLNDPTLDANVAATLMRHTDWLNPVTCMHTDDLQLLARTAGAIPALRVHNSNWREPLAELIAHSGSIVFYVEGDSPGVAFEVEQVRAHGLAARTVVVFKGPNPPIFANVDAYAAVLPIGQFLETTVGTGAARLSSSADVLLRRLAGSAPTGATVPDNLLGIPCRIVDPAGASAIDEPVVDTDYLVTDSNADAFVNYVVELPDSMLRWNAISQDMRLRGIQPSLENFNALYRSLRMAFVSATCLGFTSSMALTLGLLSKVASMAKLGTDEDRARVAEYMRVLDIAQRFDALTENQAWQEKIEAYRESILEDPFFR